MENRNLKLMKRIGCISIITIVVVLICITYFVWKWSLEQMVNVVSSTALVVFSFLLWKANTEMARTQRLLTDWSIAEHLRQHNANLQVFEQPGILPKGEGRSNEWAYFEASFYISNPGLEICSLLSIEWKQYEMPTGHGWKLKSIYPTTEIEFSSQPAPILPGSLVRVTSGRFKLTQELLTRIPTEVPLTLVYRMGLFATKSTDLSLRVLKPNWMS